MEINVKDKTINIEMNSKPYLGKHLLSILFDVGILFLLFFLLNLGFLNSKVADAYHRHTQTYTQIEDKYKLESGVGLKKWVDELENTGDFVVYLDEETSREYIVVVDKQASSEALTTYSKLLKEDESYQEAKFAAGLQSYAISVLSCSISEILLFLIIPLCNTQRATGGQLLTGISLISPGRQSYAKWYQIVGRFLFIFIIESCFIYLWVGIYTFFLIPILDLIVMLLNKRNRSLMDYISGTMAIEKMSYMGPDK